MPGEAMHRWIGGYYETHYSVNPMWKPSFDKFPNHPITRGVLPFATHDEWYFSMRWTPDPAPRAKITPILVATPSDEVRKGPYVSPRGPYEHIIAASGQAETMMWTFERPDGGRGFGFTGGHTHANWGDPNQRKIMLNALLWLAKVDVPRSRRRRQDHGSGSHDESGRQEKEIGRAHRTGRLPPPDSLAHWLSQFSVAPSSRRCAASRLSGPRLPSSRSARGGSDVALLCEVVLGLPARL